MKAWTLFIGTYGIFFLHFLLRLSNKRIYILLVDTFDKVCNKNKNKTFKNH